MFTRIRPNREMQYVHQANLIFMKIDNNIYKNIKSRYGSKGYYIGASETIEHLNEDSKVVIIDEQGTPIHANFEASLTIPRQENVFNEE